MAVGDLNATPEEFMQPPWAKKLKVIPVCPNVEATFEWQRPHVGLRHLPTDLQAFLWRCFGRHE
eukprot:7521616-Pyramimonas_sp.AAC.1